MVAESVGQANKEREESEKEQELKRKAEAESLASSQEQAPKKAREDVTSAMQNVSLASSQGQHPQPQHEEDGQMSAERKIKSKAGHCFLSSSSEDEGGVGGASGAGAESESSTPASSRRQEEPNIPIASETPASSRRQEEENTASIVAASRLEMEVKHNLESLRCAVPPTNLLVGMSVQKWVLSGVGETEHEVMLVIAERTLLLYLRTTQPKNMYEPLTKGEVAKLLKALEVQYLAMVSGERKQVCSRICMHPCSSLFVSLLDGIKNV